MATRALSIIVPDAATPAAPIALPAPTNDNLPCWTADPRAKRLLASCAASMPQGEWKRAYHAYGYGKAFRYVGYRAEALDAIRTAFGQQVLDAYHSHGDAAYPLFSAWCRSISVTDAIDAAAETALAAQMEG